MMKVEWLWAALTVCFLSLSSCTHSAKGPAQKLANELLQEMKESGRLVDARAGLTPPVIRAGESATLVTAVRIKPGWHIYAPGGVSRYAIPTRLEVKLPEGISPVAGWQYPPGKGKSGRDELIYENSVVISGSLKSAAGLNPGRRSLMCTVYYVACDESICLRLDAQSLKVDFDIIR
jgi:DsbC/DsbD-like thiol-disulfide interchange protein